MRLFWSNAARQDLARIFDFNADYDWDRAATIDRRLAEAAEGCAARPLAGRAIRDTAVRERSVTDIQYVVRYRIDEETVTILGVRHTRENMETP